MCTVSAKITLLDPSGSLSLTRSQLGSQGVRDKRPIERAMEKHSDNPGFISEFVSQCVAIVSATQTTTTRLQVSVRRPTCLRVRLTRSHVSDTL